MGCRCPKVTRNVSVIRSPCSCPPACQSSPPQPIQNVRPAARSGAERSPARSGDTNSKPPVDCLKSSRSSMFQLNVAALVATQFLEIPNPEGFQLIKFKDLVLRHLAHGTKEHTVTAFWEYLFLLELAYKLLEKDRNTYVNDHTIREHYLKVHSLYQTEQFTVEGDFAERMLKLTQSIADAFEVQSQNAATTAEQQLTRPQITEFLYLHNLKELRDAVVAYLKLKQVVWILFDNIDKGW